MILSPKNRVLATEFFIKGLSPAVQKLILDASILLSTKDARFIASAVAFSADGTTAYILSAKHNLWVFAGAQCRPGAPPSTLTQGFQDNVAMFWGAAAIGQKPRNMAPITTITFPVGNDSWDDDAMLLTSTDAALVAHILGNGYVKNRTDAEINIEQLVCTEGGRGAQALDQEKRWLVQVGFGHGQDGDISSTKGWPDYSGQLQCRIVTPVATQPAATVYDVPAGVPKKEWRDAPSYGNQLLWLPATTTPPLQATPAAPCFRRPRNSPKSTCLSSWSG